MPENRVVILSKQKGISENVVAQFFDDDTYSEFETALNFARKKKIGRFRTDESARLENRQKDLATLVRAGFDYDVAKEILEDEN